MSAAATDIGMNRTGMQTSPLASKDMLTGSAEGKPTSAGTAAAVQAWRADFAREAQPVGTVPPPGTVKGMAKSAMQAIKGDKVSVFVDKLGQRLGAARMSARLYETALMKFEVHGTWEGGPTREALLQHRVDALTNLARVRSAIETLGADPTAMTPAANLAALTSLGIPGVVSDPRTSLRESLDGILASCLFDEAGWELTVDIAHELGHKQLAGTFELSLAASHQHVLRLKEWLRAGAMSELKVGGSNAASLQS